jgi:outer membrane protein
MGLRPIAVCSALFAFSQVAAAQVKVAVVNLQDAVFKSAEILKADSDMQARYKPRQDEVDRATAEGKDLVQKYEAGRTKMIESSLAELQAQIQRKQRDLQRLQEDLSGDVERDRNEVLSKASQKMGEVVKKLAEEKGVDLVVDSTPGSSILYFKPAMDLTADAVAAYNKAYPAAAVAAKPAPKPAAK